MVKIYFETLSPGLRARLDARYRVNSNHRMHYTNGTLRKSFRNGSGGTTLEDDVKMGSSRVHT